MQDESITTIQETPNSQFRLVLSVTPCMPRVSSLESVNDSTSPLLFSSTSSLTFGPTSESPKDQLAPLISKLLLTHVLTLAPSMIKPNHPKSQKKKSAGLCSTVVMKIRNTRHYSTICTSQYVHGACVLMIRSTEVYNKSTI